MSNRNIGDADTKTSSTAYMIVIPGLLAVVVLAYAGALYLVLVGKASDSGVFVTLGTAALTGLLGLFAPSPKTPPDNSGQ